MATTIHIQSTPTTSTSSSPSSSLTYNPFLYDTRSPSRPSTKPNNASSSFVDTNGMAPSPYHHHFLTTPQSSAIKSEGLSPVNVKQPPPIKNNALSSSGGAASNKMMNLLNSSNSILETHGSPSTSSNPQQGNMNGLKGALERYFLLAAQETHLVHQLTSGVVSSSLVRILANELQMVLTHKLNEVKQILVGEEESKPSIQHMQQQPQIQRENSNHNILQQSQSNSISNSRDVNCRENNNHNHNHNSLHQSGGSIPIKRPIQYPNPVLIVEDQPSGNVVANKYLEPPLVVKVDDCLKDIAREGKLQVVASLCLTLTDEVLARTIDNKQDILQGHTVMPVTAEGYATFNKLKIMEVSSKHQHQAFSIQLQLQETHNVSSNQVGEAIKLAPLHVQSRINKRKRSCFGHGRPRKRARGESDCNYVDITALLVLPQKEAATRLGISESMLCKRFKECTRRKWPYRYLRKIDKMIRVLTLNKKSDSIPREDQEKIQKLKREREECLHPVKIRITGNDKLATRRLNLSPVTNFANDIEDNDDDIEEETENETVITKPSDSDSDTNDSNSSPCEEEEVREDDDEIALVASTLNLLKQD